MQYRIFFDVERDIVGHAPVGQDAALSRKRERGVGGRKRKGKRFHPVFGFGYKERLKLSRRKKGIGIILHDRIVKLVVLSRILRFQSLDDLEDAAAHAVAVHDFFPAVYRIADKGAHGIAAVVIGGGNARDAYGVKTRFVVFIEDLEAVVAALDRFCPRGVDRKLLALGDEIFGKNDQSVGEIGAVLIFAREARDEAKALNARRAQLHAVHRKGNKARAVIFAEARENIGAVARVDRDRGAFIAAQE